jgi:hypothetical protein
VIEKREYGFGMAQRWLRCARLAGAFIFLNISVLSAQSVVFSEYDLPVFRTSLKDRGYFGGVKEYRNLSGVECALYNESGFLVEEVGPIALPNEKKGDSVRILYAYDGANNLTQITWTSNKIIYKYERRKIAGEEQYIRDTLLWKAFYFYEGERVAEKRIYKGTGEFSHSYIFSYNEQGDVSEILRRTSRPDSEIDATSAFMEYYYEYDDAGRKAVQAWGAGGSKSKVKAVVENFSYDEAGLLTGKTRGTYDDNISGYKFLKGSEQTDAVRNKTAQLDDVTRWVYTREGRLQEESTHEHSRYVARYREKRRYAYDDEGRLLQEEYFENGVQKSEKIYAHDAGGNPVRMREYAFIDAFGEITKSLIKEEEFAFIYYAPAVPAEDEPGTP